MTDSGVAGMDAFTHLGGAVRDALSDRGFETPTEPQRRAIPPLADGRNALVVAPTGTGKTETAMLPVFDAIVEGEDRFGLSALYVTPLRALNRDMRDRLEWWGERLGVEVDVRHGDTTRYRRSQQADDPPDVLITTPETLQAILTGEKLRRALADVAHVVIDEVHELAASKRGAQLTVGLERLRDLAGSFQRIGLSATVGDPDEVGRFLTGDRGCAVVETDDASAMDVRVVRPEVTAEDERLAAELATDADLASHVRAIRDVVRAHESTLIFVNTRRTAEALGSRFRRLDEPIGVHHGSLSTEARLDVEDRFKAGEIDGLVCTSSMELGIDVGSVDHVVQYNSPREVARLLQRVGRAGHRRDRTSHGTVVAGSPEDALEALAIARRAGCDAVEPADIHHGSLDVAANQVVGVVMDRGEVSARRAYDLLTAAYPFRELSEADFRAVVRELSGNRVLWLDEDADRLEKSGGSWQYYYRNLSMIPDEETYRVRDVSARRTIGTLDERFVRTFAEPGATFVQRGELWRVTEVDDEESRVDVSPVEDPGGEVPSWTGKEIPVPAAVAGEVGELRDVAAEQFVAGADRDAVARDLVSRYPTDERTLRAALGPVERQVEADHPVPTADRLVLEATGGTAVLNAPCGHEINETIGRLVAALVGQQTGSSVGMDADPYRIEFDLPRRASVGDVLDALETTDPDHVEPLLELALKRSDALKFALTHVAATFGRLKRYRGDGRMGADRLLAALDGTPVFDEAVRELFHEDLAVEATARLLDRIQSGEVAVVTARERTPLGTAGRSTGRELLVPENADAGVIETVKERIHGDRVRLLCLHCADWESRRRVGGVRDQPRCPECESTRIAALNPWDEETPAAVRSDPADRDDEAERRVERAYRSAGLVQSHGKRAVIAMAARGVGPQTAARIIGNLRTDEDDFYRDILEQERRYARTNSFWD
ncbi:MAG: DEAD/DEAH box helicase [Haloferacaceae archaeon]